MGFQILRFRARFFVALNATVIIPLDELLSSLEARGQVAAYFAGGADQLDRAFDFLDLSDAVLAFSQLPGEPGAVPPGLTPPGLGSSPPPTSINPRRPHSYYRFVATPRDKRISPQGGFLPGTYATTFTDLPFAPSGFAAVGRYALPNPASARFVVQITTYDVPTLVGTATPNFGQAGGGVEVLFGNGASLAAGASFMIAAG